MVVKRNKTNPGIINLFRSMLHHGSNFSLNPSKHSQFLFPIIKKFLLVLLLLFPFVFLSVFISPATAAITTFNQKFTDDCVVSLDDFMESEPEKIADYAYKFEKLQETYNMPYNLTGDGWDYYVHMNVYFNYNPLSDGIDNITEFLDVCDPLDTSHQYNQIKSWTNTGHCTVYSGFTGMGEACRYAVAVRENNATAVEESREHLLHLVKAYDLLSAITPDGSMVRFTAPDTPTAREYIPELFHESWTGSHLYYKTNYTGPNNQEYTFYCETGTSIDCYQVYNALGFIYLLCNDTEIRNIVKTTVDRMLTYHTTSSWRFIDNDGKSHSMGAEALTGSPFIDPMYCLTYLRVGKTVNPEKWGNLYDQYAYDRLFSKSVGKHSEFQLFSMFIWSGSYFNLNLASTIAGTLCFLEDDPVLKERYQEQFLESVRSIGKYHRNAWFDVLYYLGMSNFDYSSYEKVIQQPYSISLTEEWEVYCDKSVGDVLTRLSYSKYPYRSFNHANGISSYETNQNWARVPNAPYPDLEIYYWEDDVDEDNFLIKTLTQALVPGRYWNESTPADWHKVSSWMWEQNPFETSIGSHNPTYQPMTGSYTAPYWIARYLNLPSVAI